MDDDDRPRSRAEADAGAAGLLAGESLERYSLDELDQRVMLIEAEIVRVAEHRRRKAAHRSAADLLFRTDPA